MDRSQKAELIATLNKTFSAAELVVVTQQSGLTVAEVTPGSAEKFNKPGFRLRAAVVETSNGPYFIRVVGPAATVARWHESIEAFLQSVRFGSGSALHW